MSVTGSPAPSASRPLSRLTPWDYAGMAAGFLLTLAITVVNSHGRVFWEDEMLGWVLLRDPSWRHMIHAWNGGADGGGFFFYLLGRAWFALFGASTLTFRLFSSTCFGLAFVVTWAALRRFYPLAIVAFATANTLFFSPPLTTHLLEGRFYGLLVLCTALGLWLTLLLDAAPGPTPKRLYLALFVTHALLTTSHVLGVVYSAALLAALLALDHIRQRRRLGLYFTVAAAWLLLIPEKTSILAAARVGQPHFWTTPPTPITVLGAYTGFSNEILFVLLALCVAAGLAIGSSPQGLVPTLRANVSRHLTVYIAALCLLLVPVAFLLEGLVGTWLFTDRYLQPVTLALAYVTAELLSILRRQDLLLRLRTHAPRLTHAAFTLGGLLFTAFTLLWVFHHTAQITPEPPDFTEALTSRLPPGIPIVVEDAFTFTSLLSHQANSGVHYTYLLDWTFAVSPNAPRLEVTQFHLMENWQHAGYFADDIQPLDTFLHQHPHFLVLRAGLINPDPKTGTPEIGNPIAERLAHTPGYQVRPYFFFDRLYHDNLHGTVWEVCQTICAQQPPLPPAPGHCILQADGTTCRTGPPTNPPETPRSRSLW